MKSLIAAALLVATVTAGRPRAAANPDITDPYCTEGQELIFGECKAIPDVPGINEGSGPDPSIGVGLDPASAGDLMRSIWKGSVAFGLVNVPVKVYSATEDHDLKFHQVHAKDNGRIQYKRVCSERGEVVEHSDIAKAYEADNGQTVVINGRRHRLTAR